MAAWKKLLTSGDVVNADLSGSAGITSANIANDTIIDADIKSNAAIAYSKLDLEDSIDAGDLTDGSVNSSEIATGAVDLAHMSSGSVDEDNLLVSNSPTDGYFLSAQSGNSGGLTWAAVAADIEAVTAGVGLSGGGSSGAVTLTLDISELSVKTSITDLDTIAITDSASAGGSKRITFENFEDAIFASVGGDIAIAEDGAATIQANAVQTGMVHDDVATELAGAGMTASSGVLNVIGGTGVTANANNIAIGQAVGTGDSPTFTDLTLSGDLTVSGATVTINTATLTVEDKLVKLADVASPSTTTANDAGIQIETSGTEVDWPHLRWNKDSALTGWGLSDHSTGQLSVAHYPISIMHQSTSSPSGDSAGIGSLWFETDAQDLYIRTS